MKKQILNKVTKVGGYEKYSNCKNQLQLNDEFNIDFSQYPEDFKEDLNDLRMIKETNIDSIKTKYYIKEKHGGMDSDFDNYII